MKTLQLIILFTIVFALAALQGFSIGLILNHHEVWGALASIPNFIVTVCGVGYLFDKAFPMS